MHFEALLDFVYQACSQFLKVFKCLNCWLNSVSGCHCTAYIQFFHIFALPGENLNRSRYNNEVSVSPASAPHGEGHFKPNSLLQLKETNHSATRSMTLLTTATEAHVRTDTPTLTSSVCIPWSYVSIIQCLRDLLYSRCERLATAGECYAEAEYANNLLKSFYSSSLSADRFRTASLGPDEWTCLTE